MLRSSATAFELAPVNGDAFRVAGWAARASSVVAAVGVVFFVLLYLGLFTGAKELLPFGPANDLCVVAQYVLVLPVVLALHRILRRHSPGASLVATIVAVVGVLGVAVFQTLLLTGALSFERQIVPASLSVLLIGVWILLVGRIGRRSGELSGSLALVVWAALYFGYAVWIWKVGRRLLKKSGEESPR